MKTWLRETKEVYLSRSEISSSDLKNILKAPRFVKIKHEETPSMRIGTLIHAVLLENKELKIKPPRAKAEDEFHVTEDTYDTVMRCVSAIRNDKFANELLWHCSEFELTGISGRRRIRVDGLCDSHIIDLKTTSDASPDRFKYQFFDLKYHLQGAYYLDTAYEIDGKARSFYFITVETKEPYNVVVYKLSNESYAKGKDLYKRALLLYEACEAFDDWDQGYVNGIVEI